MSKGCGIWVYAFLKEEIVDGVVEPKSWLFQGKGLCKRNLGESDWVAITLVEKGLL